MNLSHHEVQKDTRKRRHYRLLLLGMFGILTAIVFFSFWIGYYPLSPSQVMTAFLSRFGYQGELLPQAVTIFWNPCPLPALPIRECSAIPWFLQIFWASPLAPVWEPLLLFYADLPTGSSNWLPFWEVLQLLRHLI